MSGQIRDYLRPTYHKIRRLAQRMRRIAPSLPIASHSYRLTRLGSGYGGWTFVDDTNLKNSVIVSCGLGEDASFDIEIASTYGAKVIIVDPTPRAIQHYKAMALRVGEKRQQPYSNTGAQPVDAYDLSNISAAQLRLCEKALWNKNTQLQFFAPSNPSHVSHSIVNFQHDYSTETAHIDVEAITIDKLFTTYDIQDLQLIKLDIEGAEVEVLKDMIAKRIYPKQVLVEYDELSVPSKKSKQRIESAHHALTNSGYSLINCEHTNFTYIRHSI